MGGGRRAGATPVLRIIKTLQMLNFFDGEGGGGLPLVSESLLILNGFAKNNNGGQAPASSNTRNQNKSWMFIIFMGARGIDCFH